MIKTKDILAMALLPALGVLTACSSDNVQTVERVPITLTANTMTVEETRAAADTALNKGYLESEQTVKVLVRNTNGTDDDWKDYIYTSAANGVLTPPSTPPFYPLDNTNVDIVAFSPSFATSTFSVLSDQTTNDSYLASDLVYASVTNKAKSTTAVPLQFEHKMAKIVVNVTAGKGVSEIRSVTLASIYPTVSFNESTGAIGSATGTKTPVTIVSDNNTPAVFGAAAIPGQTVVGDLLTIVTDLGTATYSVNSKTFTAGKMYKLTISVSKTSVNATTEITNWTDTEGVVVKTGDDNVKVFTVESNEWPSWKESFVMIKVEGGSYSTFGGVAVNGTISDFYIGQLEVTNALWAIIMDDARPANQKENGNRYPVTMVSYADINAATTGFLARLNARLADQLDGMTFQLPSEAQWEYAARGGTKHEDYIYAGSNMLNWVSWNSTNSNGTIHLVASEWGANSLGLFDMSGNAYEICKDYYSTSIPTTQNDYVNTTPSDKYSWRGGSWADNATNCAVASRVGGEIAGRWNTGGFRLVLQ